MGAIEFFFYDSDPDDKTMGLFKINLIVSYHIYEYFNTSNLKLIIEHFFFKSQKRIIIFI